MTAVLECGHTATPTSCTPGYGTDALTKERFCHPCAGLRDAATLRSENTWTGYLVATTYANGQAGRYVVSNWPGSLTLPTAEIHRNRRGGGFGSERIDVWFQFEGALWHGINRGDNNTILRCRRIKTNATRKKAA